MSSATSRLRGRVSTKPSSASSVRASSRPPSRGGQNSSNVPAYMNQGAAARRAVSPAASVKSSSSRARLNNTSPTGQKRKMRDDDGPLDTNVQVVVRCRGRSEREIRESSDVILSCPGGPVGKEVDLAVGPLPMSNKTYTFDKVFGPEADQSMIYDEVVQPILGEVCCDCDSK